LKTATDVIQDELVGALLKIVKEISNKHTLDNLSVPKGLGLHETMLKDIRTAKLLQWQMRCRECPHREATIKVTKWGGRQNSIQFPDVEPCSHVVDSTERPVLDVTIKSNVSTRVRQNRNLIMSAWAEGLPVQVIRMRIGLEHSPWALMLVSDQITAQKEQGFTIEVRRGNRAGPFVGPFFHVEKTDRIRLFELFLRAWRGEGFDTLQWMSQAYRTKTKWTLIREWIEITKGTAISLENISRAAPNISAESRRHLDAVWLVERFKDEHSGECVSFSMPLGGTYSQRPQMMT
jgi:hypothetical protein